MCWGIKAQIDVGVLERSETKCSHMRGVVGSGSKVAERDRKNLQSMVHGEK